MTSAAQRKRVRQRYQMAHCVAAALCPERTTFAMPPTVGQYWSRLQRLQQLLTRARQANLQGAVQRLERYINLTAQHLRSDLYRLTDTLTAGQQQRIDVKDVYEELTALDGDFEDVEFKPRVGVISVTTEPIELEDHYLGAFEIRLPLRYMKQTRPYQIIAVDPNPAGTCDSTTHPHVQGENLCEGEGSGGDRPVACERASARLLPGRSSDPADLQPALRLRPAGRLGRGAV